MRRSVAVIVMFCFASLCIAQSASWQREEKTDPLRGTAYSQFTLTGKFLTPPKLATTEPPVFIVKCIPDDHHKINGGFINGKFLDAYVIARGVLDRTSKGHVAVQYRLDDGKMHTEFWGAGTDGTAAFPQDIELNTILYGHFMKHKEGTNPPVHKVVMGMHEYLGAEIVVQFDMPDPDQVADACGLLIRKQ
jgi:hypothetical protein